MTDLIYSLDSWNRGIASLRKILEDQGANVNGEYKKERKILLDHIDCLDRKAQFSDLSAEDWITRYKVEEELEKKKLHY